MPPRKDGEMYIVKRRPVRYKDGTYSREYYYKGVPLGLFYELTVDAREAAVFARKSEAADMAKRLGSNYCVVRLDKEGKQ